MQILVTGGCGYKGTVIVPRLLAEGHTVVVVDAMWFGNRLTSHPKLTVVQHDIRHPEGIPMAGVDAVIHLASVANDPCGELDPKLTWEIGPLATMRLAERAIDHGVPRIIYASSGSVYGVKAEEQVTEGLSLEPISDYNKTKMVTERVLMSYEDRIKVQIVRPATVCGYSRRMRLDVVVNMLTVQALTRGAITVLGGDQIRPNIHIEDMADVYLHLLHRPDLTGVFNAGFENLAVREIAERIAAVIPAEITVQPSNDPRSYRINSDKLLATGYLPKRSVSTAIEGLVRLYREGVLVNGEDCYNLQWMQRRMAEIGVDRAPAIAR